MQHPAEQLTERRTDLSAFLVHLTREYDGQDAEENLVSMAASLCIEARNAFGLAKEWDERLASSERSQRVVCFSETPLEHLWMLCEPIQGRQSQLAPYGWIFRRDRVRELRGNPVWYLDTTPAGAGDWLTKPFQALIANAVGLSRSRGDIDDAKLARQRIFEITPFLETMGEGKTFRKDFHWEREWRHVGDVRFVPTDIVAVLAPEATHGALRQRFNELAAPWSRTPRPFLDPQWSSDRCVTHLAAGGWMVRQPNSP